MRHLITAVGAAVFLTTLPAAAPPPGTFAIAINDARPADRPFAEAVEQALAERGFTAMPDRDHGRYRAEVTVEREKAGLVTSPVPRGQSSVNLSGGASVQVPLASNKRQVNDLVVTRLTVRLVERSDGRAVWAGSAVTARAGTANVAPALARAAVSSFPRSYAEPVSVP